MAWIQLLHRTNWHSAICAQVKDTSRTIRAMYSELLNNYPDSLVEADDDIDFNFDEAADVAPYAGRNKSAPLRYEFKGFEGAQNVRTITGRNCRVTIASAECQDSVRGSDIAMAHLSEVAFWGETSRRDPEDLMRSVCSSIPLEPYTLVALESTANGVGNFFHKEWLRAEARESDKEAVFVPWYEIEMYSLHVPDPEELWKTMTPYEKNLWEAHGCTLEQINWYRHKLREYGNPAKMHAEFPTTPVEAFVSSDGNVFVNDFIERMRRDCREPVCGELDMKRFRFEPAPRGEFSVWEEPCKDASYLVSVDVGGRSESSDWSVVCVLKRPDPRNPVSMPEVVAQWRGHTYHDLLADKAMDIARFYNEALLVIESNTLETMDDAQSPASVLHRVDDLYSNTYRRKRSRCRDDVGSAVGFHTNRHTKALVIDHLLSLVREHGYIERDSTACNEMSTYSRMPNGSYQARHGNHDDVLMTRAIGLYVMATESDLSIDDIDSLSKFVYYDW